MSNSDPHPTYEEKEIRCPKLGGPVNFEYCRLEQSDMPCSRALTCWSVHFDVEAFFREGLTSEDFERCFLTAPPSKVATLLELVERARKIAEDKNAKNKEFP
ncbi:MAG: hypothetical protein RDU20_07620 [Desulfomonilaceae bacterium]|nr:hypothetical protein [Desulfomonilaceae bacterium]